MLSDNGLDFCLITDIKFPHDTLRVLNTHLESVRFGKEDYNFVKDLKDSDNPKNSDFIQGGSRKIFSKMKMAYIKRVEQIGKLTEIIDHSPYAILLVGDFNDTPVSFAYHQVSKRLNDSFVEAGTGIGQTYAGMIPILRIDYIFASESIKIKRFETIRKEFSDHYPIIAWATLSGKK
jgi:endonuclease/exonuclease/phosphatase family metal-dependent hydrolase